MALSKTYISFCIARVFAGLTSAFSQTVPPSTIADIFVKDIRGHKMSMFGVAVIIAPVVAPFICGLVVSGKEVTSGRSWNGLAHHQSPAQIRTRPWQDLFWIVLGLAGLQLAMFFLLVPETLWIEDARPPTQEHAPTELQAVTSGHDAKSKGCEGQHIEEGSVVPQLQTSVPAGHCGPAWMPWQRPREYFRIFMSPILMVSVGVPSGQRDVI
jgi:MFS family permease